MNPVRIGGAALSLCVVVGVLAGCTTSNTIGPSKVEQAIVQQGKTAGITLTNLNCPSSIAAKVGTKFTCTASAGTTTVSYAVNIDSINGSTVHFKFDPVSPILDFGKISANIAKQIGAGTTVDCGAPIQQLAIGAKVTCTASQGSQTQSIQLQVNQDGSVTQADASTTTTSIDTTTLPQ